MTPQDYIQKVVNTEVTSAYADDDDYEGYGSLLEMAKHTDSIAEK